MPVSIAASGTQNATVGTSHTLVTQTAPAGGAVYQLRARANALANGERVQLQVLVDGATGGTLGTLYDVTFANVQGETYKDSPAIAIPAGGQLRAVLRQEGGTGRAFPWWLYRLDG